MNFSVSSSIRSETFFIKALSSPKTKPDPLFKLIRIIHFSQETLVTSRFTTASL